MKTVTRYLTRRPEWKAGQELRSLVMTLPRTTEEIFKTSLNQWLVRWVNFLSEKTIDPTTDHWHYTHRRIRGAFASIKHTLPYLFTYQRFPDLKIPHQRRENQPEMSIKPKPNDRRHADQAKQTRLPQAFNHGGTNARACKQHF